MFHLRRNQDVDLHKQEQKTVPEWIKDADSFLNYFFFNPYFLILRKFFEKTWICRKNVCVISPV